MIEKLIFILLMMFLAAIDYKTMLIPNFIVIPGVIIGVLLTGNWHWALVAFLAGALLYEKKIMGGDVKLFSMIAAFLGIKFIGVAVFAFIINYAYRNFRYVPINYGLPFAPFCFLSSLLFMW